MPSYTPTVTPYSSGVVTIETMSGTSYEEIQQSMGAYNYQLKELYIKTNGNPQILEPLNFLKYDSNGEIVERKTVPTVDPKQYQTSIFYKFQSKGYIFDGKLSVGFNVLPSEEIFMYFDTICFRSKGLLPYLKDNIFDDWFDRIYYK